MLFRVLAVSGLSLLSLASVGQAQGLSGPRELPPPGFTGQQYVDSRGCVFLRGGVAGTTTWVPRVSANRRQLCGMPPSFTPAPAPVAVAEAPRAEPPAAVAPRRAGDPLATVATTTTAPAIRDTSRRTAIPAERYAAPPVVNPSPAPRAVAAAPVAAPEPAPVVRTARAASITPGCPAHAPYGERLLTTDGRSALLCVATADGIPDFARRLGAATGRIAAPAPQPVAVAPRAEPAPVARVASTPVTVAPVAPASPVGPRYYPDGRVSCPASQPVAQRFPLQGGGSTLLCTTGGGGMDAAVAGYVAPSGRTAAPIDPVTVPRGYRLAWQDDRLNPRRGLGTAAGQAAQDGVWSREVPARQVATATRTRVTTSASNAPRKAAQAVTLSTSAAPVARAVPGRFYVQVGSFGVPSNADGARGRLAGMGLPVATGRGSIKGKAVQVVHAGPFATEAEARRALSVARGAGFADAFIR
ncbi:MAG: SPOR domain-containing protein [Paracoccaceae bacterium]|nr:MAG: SPOR domain-containing protein [Paracoccaceae bacterium]